jgi:hypothetical protein
MSRNNPGALAAVMRELKKRDAKAAASSDLSTLSVEDLRGVRQRSINKGDDRTQGAVQKELEARSRKKCFPENVQTPSQIRTFLDNSTDEAVCEMFNNTPQTNPGYYRLYEEINRRGLGPLGRKTP